MGNLIKPHEHKKRGTILEMLKRRRRRLKQNTHTHRARESVVQNLHRLLWSVKRDRNEMNMEKRI